MRLDKMHYDSEAHVRWLTVRSNDGLGPITTTVYGLTCQGPNFGTLARLLPFCKAQARYLDFLWISQHPTTYNLRDNYIILVLTQVDDSRTANSTNTRHYSDTLLFQTPSIRYHIHDVQTPHSNCAPDCSPKHATCLRTFSLRRSDRDSSPQHTVSASK
jgi:hypothetical protein